MQLQQLALRPTLAAASSPWLCAGPATLGNGYQSANKSPRFFERAAISWGHLDCTKPCADSLRFASSSKLGAACPLQRLALFVGQGNWQSCHRLSLPRQPRLFTVLEWIPVLAYLPHFLGPIGRVCSCRTPLLTQG